MFTWVLLPVRIQSDPSRVAVACIDLNDEPAFLSLIDSENTSVPSAMPRSHRPFCSSLPQSSSQRWPWMATWPLTIPCRPISSLMTTYSATPPPSPPHSTGTSGPTYPRRPSSW